MKKILLGIGIGVIIVFALLWCYGKGLENGNSQQKSITQTWIDKYNGLNSDYEKINNSYANYLAFSGDIATLAKDYKQQNDYYLAEIKYLENGEYGNAALMIGGINQLTLEINNILSKYSQGGAKSQ